MTSNNCLVAGLPKAGDHCDFKHPLGMFTNTAKIAVKVLTARMPGNAFLDWAAICVLKVSYKSTTSSYCL